MPVCHQMSRITLALIAAAGALAPTAAYAQKPARAAAPRVTYSSATRPLYQFRRDDAAPVTRIHIAAGHQGSTPLSQNVFGNFIEHLGNAIYEILWANVLLNPNLEKIADADKAPPAWQMAGAATTRKPRVDRPDSLKMPAHLRRGHRRCRKA